MKLTKEEAKQAATLKQSKGAAPTAAQRAELIKIAKETIAKADKVAQEAAETVAQGAAEAVIKSTGGATPKDDA